MSFLENKKKDYESDSSDSYSDEEEEYRKDYRVGGYHPVEVHYFYILYCVTNRLARFSMNNTKFCAKWGGDSILRYGLLAI